MSWSLDVFSPRREPVTIAELESQLAFMPPPLRVIFSSPPENANSATDQWRDLALSEDSERIVARVQVMDFAAEREADPQLLPILQKEILESDEEDDAIDEEYDDHLRDLLSQTCWHYVVSVRQNGRPEQEHAVVRAAYALSKIGGGIVHDLQSGAWMEAALFESLLDAYGVKGID